VASKQNLAPLILVRSEFEPSASLRKELRQLHREISGHFLSEEVQTELVFLKPQEVQKLNLRYRSKNKPTDVLSFSSQRGGFLGSIVICPEVAVRQARAYGHSLEQEVAELFVHGMLHLLGFDHEQLVYKDLMKHYEHFFNLGIAARLSAK